MDRRAARRGHSRPLINLVLLICALLVPSRSAWAQDASSISGVVVDELGAVISGARITMTDGKGLPVRSATSDAAGAFTLRSVPPGSYTVLVEMNLFTPTSQTLTIPSSGPSPALRVVLKAGGLVEAVVVTAQRIETRLAETPQRVEVVDATDIQRTVSADLTDVLKKNAGVDVVQYTGALSGIGIRGFRPQTSGINKRLLPRLFIGISHPRKACPRI